MSKIVEFPKMMYHKDGEASRIIKSAAEQEDLGEDWVEQPVHPDHGRQAPEKPRQITPGLPAVSPAPNEKPADKPSEKKAKKKGDKKDE